MEEADGAVVEEVAAVGAAGAEVVAVGGGLDAAATRPKTLSSKTPSKAKAALGLMW
jgi:hypothetical protein